MTLITDRWVRIGSLCGMEWKATKLYSITHFTCPRCHEGAFFLSHPYNLAKAGDTHDNCPVCGQKYNLEPGFYYGAMYVSYAIGVAVCVTAWVAMVVLAPNLGVFPQIATICGVMLLGSPMFYALSKIIWANMFIHYRGSENSLDGAGLPEKH